MEKDIVHRDISYSNILLLEPIDDAEDEIISEAFRSALLIDFEYAAHLSDAYAMSPGLRTVRILFSPIHL
jgi:thiamine kinase-like enzyme